MTKTKIQSHKWLKSGVRAHVRPHCLFEARWVRGNDDDDDGGDSSIDYVWYIHNIGFDARDIVPTMLIMFPINKYKHSERHSHMCVYDLTHWDTQPFIMCTFVWQNNLMPLFIFQKQVPKTQTSERINKQFKFSSFKCAYFNQKNDHINKSKSKQSIRNMHREFQCFDFLIQFEIFNFCFDALKCMWSSVHNTIVRCWKENKINTRNVMCFIVLTQAQYSTSIAFRQHTFTHTNENPTVSAHTSTQSLSQHSMLGKQQTHTTRTHTQIHPSTVAVT